MNILEALLAAALSTGPFQNPRANGDPKNLESWWMYHPYFNTNKETRSVNYSDDAHRDCSSIYGQAWNGKRMNGCVQYVPDDNYGLQSISHVQKDSPFLERIIKHEDRHADGWMHPSPEYLRQIRGR